MEDFSLQALHDELVNDPSGRGYTGDARTDEAILNDVRASIQLNRTAIPMGEIYGAVDWIADWLPLEDPKKAAFRQITSTEYLDVRSPTIHAAFAEIFSGTDTLTALQAILTEAASRSAELWGRPVTAAEIDDARAL